MPHIQSVNPTKLQYNSRTKSLVSIEDGVTVQSLFRDNADDLGIDMGRPVTYRCGAETIPSNTPAVAGRTYVATVSFEAKGSN